MAEEMSEEQIKALQEKIKNMSPEELKEFQRKQCIFCQIIAGRVQSRKVYEDDKVIGLLDINPANPGHVLLLTKEHYSIMPQVPEDELSHVFLVSKQLSNSMLRSLDSQGTNLIVANGVAAGQRAQHFMVHVIPRKEHDSVNFVLPQKTMEQGDIDNIGNRLIASLGGVVEIKEERKASASNTMPAIQEKKGKPETDAQIKHAKSGLNLDEISRLLGVK